VKKQFKTHNLLALFLLVLLSSGAFAQEQARDTIKLYFLGGQSNMDGYGLTAELPKDLTAKNKNAYIFHGNPVPDESENGGLGKWEVLQAGHGVGFSSDGITNKYSDRFGIELTFAQKIQELYPHQKIAFIKYSRGGSSIDSVAARSFGSWEMDYRGTNGINQYDHFLSTIRAAFKHTDIDGDGKEEVLQPEGIIWMQGESDAAFTEEVALRYYANLKRLMDLIRASLHHDDLPVVIGKISDSWNHESGKVWQFGELVQYAQEKYARTDRNATIVRSTRYYKYSDPWHYNSAGYIDLGEKFAEAIYRLNEQ
jgi:hypothetical protein